MNLVDIIIIVILVLGFARGVMRGLIIELASLIALIAGVYGAIHFSYYAIDLLTKYVSWDEEYIQIVGIALTFLLIIILIILAGKLLTKLAGVIALGIVNRILGGVFGLIKFAFILSVALMFTEGLNKNISFISEEKFEESVLFEPIKKVAPIILPPVLKGIEETKEKLNV
ncbi:CvpA family protein [Mesonia aestuariivivens]|uniref:CvpA family protein n=1 Tax=Mesonia aestuariivivens TaxID=2796128 RepID=A0ABS6VXE0_9FLAO|nr:CvpA family protein [Mesonia aestuariivivens]MBW2960260.1 CvpA family protein [Mesonia aestuariivivens]